MQLTKKDRIGFISEKTKKGKLYLDFSKFQQVVEFYEKYINSVQKFGDENPKLLKKFLKETNQKSKEGLAFILLKHNSYKIWLFNYCFKEGLK